MNYKYGHSIFNHIYHKKKENKENKYRIFMKITIGDNQKWLGQERLVW